MLIYALVTYPWLTEYIKEIDGKDASLSTNEAKILAYFHSFYRNGLPIHPAKKQIARAIELGEKGEKTVQRAIQSLQDKGYIHVVEKGNSKGKANRYEFCPGRTLWELFQLVDKENPGLISKDQRLVAEKDLSPVTTQTKGSRDNATQKHTEPINGKPVSNSSATSKTEGKSVGSSSATSKTEGKSVGSSSATSKTEGKSMSERVTEKAGGSDGKKQKVDAHGWKVLTPEEIKENKNRVWKEKYRGISEHWKNELDHIVKVPEIIKDLRGEEAEKCLKGEEVINQDKWFNPPDDVLDFINGLGSKGFTVAIGRYWDGIAFRCSNLGETKFNLHVVKEEKLENGIYIAHYDRGQK